MFFLICAYIYFSLWYSFLYFARSKRTKWKKFTGRMMRYDVIAMTTHLHVHIINFASFHSLWNDRVFVMPPKTKRLRSLQESARRAREGMKQARIEVEAGSSVNPEQEVTLRTEGPSSLQPTIVEATFSDCSSDVTYEEENELSASPNLRIEQFVEEWVLSLSHDSIVSLGLLLCYQLEHLVGFTATNAAEYASVMLGKSDRTIRQWKTDFVEKGEIPNSQQGRYQRSGILWSSEDLNRKASKY